MQTARTHTITTLFAGYLLIVSCDNSLDLTDEPTNETIVYALLEPGAPAQYIRVQRSFLDEEKSALEVARESDSLYYENAQVRLIARPDSAPEDRDTMVCYPIDATEDGLEREDGIFARYPNLLYKTTDSIHFGERYRLDIRVPEKKEPMLATADVVGDMRFTRPTEGQALALSNYDKKNRVSWVQAKNGAVYEMYFLFHFRERNTKTGEEAWKQVKWVIFKNKSPGGNLVMSHNVDNEHFFTNLRSRLDPHPDLVRFPGYLELFIYTAGPEIVEYLRAERTLQFSITQTMRAVTYSNIYNALGIFSSRHKKILQPLYLDAQTRDSLACGQYTRQLRFNGHQFCKD